MCLAVPGMLKEISGTDPISRTGSVDFSGILKEISLSFVPKAKVGDYVLVHAGFAISVVDEKEALETLDLLKELEPEPF